MTDRWGALAADAAGHLTNAQESLATAKEALTGQAITDDQLFTFMEMVMEVAISVPPRHAKYRGGAIVSWDLIERMRAALDAVGYDWRTSQRDLKLRQEEHRMRTYKP